MGVKDDEEAIVVAGVSPTELDRGCVLRLSMVVAVVPASVTLLELVAMVAVVVAAAACVVVAVVLPSSVAIVVLSVPPSRII